MTLCAPICQPVWQAAIIVLQSSMQSAVSTFTFSEGGKFHHSSTHLSLPVYVCCPLLYVSLYIINEVGSGNCWLQPPFGPVLKPLQRRDHIDFAGLVWSRILVSMSTFAVWTWGTPSRPCSPSPSFPIWSMGFYPLQAFTNMFLTHFSHKWVRCQVVLHIKPE